jgi:hypothetical protein
LTLALHPQDISSVTARKIIDLSRKLKQEEWISFLNE